MSRHSSSGSTSHRVVREGRDEYRISWVVDRYYAGSRLRFPRTYQRDTDEAGARRFAKRHGIEFPEVPKTEVELRDAVMRMMRETPITAAFIARRLGVPEGRVTALLRRLRTTSQAKARHGGWVRAERKEVETR